MNLIIVGWQDNPVEFDSVFNQSYKTYAFGYPTIVDIFKRGKNLVTNYWHLAFMERLL